MISGYLTVSQLSPQIQYTEQSIYNLIHSGTFIEGRHFFKPTPKKILFKWQEVVRWIEGKEGITIEEDNAHSCQIDQVTSGSKLTTSSINI